MIRIRTMPIKFGTLYHQFTVHSSMDSQPDYLLSKQSSRSLYHEKETCKKKNTSKTLEANERNSKMPNISVGVRCNLSHTHTHTHRSSFISILLQFVNILFLFELVNDFEYFSRPLRIHRILCLRDIGDRKINICGVNIDKWARRTFTDRNTHTHTPH